MADGALFNATDSTGTRVYIANPDINPGFKYDTPPSTPKPAAPAPTSPTISDIYGTVSQQDQGVDASLAGFKAIADTPVDEGQIRNDTMKRLQAEIDATNSVYAEKMRQATIAGAGRIGENTAISARRGILGSDFGSQAADKVVSDNSAIYSGIDTERQNAIAGITDKGAQFAQQEIANKTAAKQQGAQNYISFLTESEKRRDTRTAAAAKEALAAGVDLTSLSSADIKSIADSYQINPSALVSTYVDSKNALTKAQLENTKTQADIAKTGADLTAPKFGTYGAPTYQYNPDTGQYEKIDAGAPVTTDTKDYEAAVAGGYQGSFTDFLGDKANLKATLRVRTDPLTGQQQYYYSSGPDVANGESGNGASPMPATGAPADTSTSSPDATKANPYAPAPLPNPQNKVQLQYLKGFTSGKPSQQKNALNTAIGHLFDADHIFKGLNAGQFPNANAITNFLNTAQGKATAKNYQQAATLVGSEIASAYGADTESERAGQAAAGAAIDSPDQHRGFVQTTATLLSSKLAANVQDWVNAMGSAPSSYDQFIAPANQVKLAVMGIDVGHLVPGVQLSQYTQALVANAHVLKNGDVYIPVDPSNPQGDYQKIQ